MFVGALIMSSGQIINNSKDAAMPQMDAMSTANFAADKLAELTPEKHNSYTPEFRPAREPIIWHGLHRRRPRITVLVAAIPHNRHALDVPS